jgi:MFS family permease
MATFFWSVYNPYWALYLQQEILLPLPMMDLLSTINQSQHLLFQLPGGILADRIGKKKVILIGVTSRIIGPGIYLWLSPLNFSSSTRSSTLISSISSLFFKFSSQKEPLGGRFEYMMLIHKRLYQR